MATNSHQYAEINDIKSLCKQENGMFFCKVNRVKTFNKNSSCAAKALFANTTFNQCENHKIILEEGYLYQKLAAGGDYLYIMTDQRQSMIECEGARRVELLKGTGIISLGRECKIMDEYDTLYPVIEDNMQLVGYLKHENWSITINEPNRKLKGLTVIQGHEQLANLPQLQDISEMNELKLKDLKFGYPAGISLGTLVIFCVCGYCGIKCGCFKLL